MDILLGVGFLNYLWHCVNLYFLMMCLQICLLCRQRGHSLKNCPDKNEENVDKKLCYNCGEFGHSLALCPQPLEDGNLPIHYSLIDVTRVNMCS